MKRPVDIKQWLNTCVEERNLTFLQLLGSRSGKDRPFLDWLKEQPCDHCGAVPWFDGESHYYSIPAHVRRVSKGAGVGIKPQWNAHSACNTCHQMEHGKDGHMLGSKSKLDRMADMALARFVVSELDSRLGRHWLEVLPGYLLARGIDWTEGIPL